MVSNQVLQNTIEGIKESGIRECGECDPGFREFTCRQSVSRTLPVL